MTDPVPAPERRLVTLGAGDIDVVMDIEHRAFDPEMQASTETVLRRFSLGHEMVGVLEDDRLVGTLAFAPYKFSLDRPEEFPTTFKVHSTRPVPPDADTLCMYSIGIDPAARSFACAKALKHGAFERGRALGLSKAIADGPLPSLNGSPIVRAKPEVKAAIDRYVATGVFPSDEEFLHDPVLALYHRLSDFRFVRLLPDFMPEDPASGGWRVLLYTEL